MALSRFAGALPPKFAHPARRVFCGLSCPGTGPIKTGGLGANTPRARPPLLHGNPKQNKSNVVCLFMRSCQILQRFRHLRSLPFGLAGDLLRDQSLVVATHT